MVCNPPENKNKKDFPGAANRLQLKKYFLFYIVSRCRETLYCPGSFMKRIHHLVEGFVMMEEDLPSAQIKTEDDITSQDFMDGFLKTEKDLLTLKSEFNHSDIYPAQVKSDPDLFSWSHGDYKEEFLDLGLQIKKEALDNLPAGLIPPIEMEEEFEITHASLDKTRNKIKTVSKENRSCKQYKTRSSSRGKSDTSSKTIRWSTEQTETTGQSNNEDVFSCETCGKAFHQLALYTDHVKIHRRQKPYTCDQCEMKFAKPSYLKIHLRRHAGDRPFPCDTCEKRFFDVYDLRVHQRDHTGERPYVCSECGKGFKRIYTLNKHKQTHSNEKPFECSVCGKAYKYGYSYRLHMKDHLD